MTSHPIDTVKVTVSFHHDLFGEMQAFGSAPIAPERIELAVQETHLISEIKHSALTELGFNTTAKRKAGDWILRIERFELEDTMTLQEVMRDVIGHATVEALLARVGTIPMRLEFKQRAPEILIATH